MWRCSTIEDQFTHQWKDETKSIILNVRKARGLGKKLIQDRQLNRRNHRDENLLIECFQNIDKELANAKRRAVYFLSPNLTLFERRNEQIELYGVQLQKHRYIIELQRELMELKQGRTRQDRWSDLPHEDQNLIEVAVHPSEDQYEEIFVKQTELMRELKRTLVRFDQELVKLRRQVEEFRNDLEDETEQDEDMSVEDQEDSEMYTNSNRYKKFRNNVFAQYYVKAKQRIKQRPRQNKVRKNKDLNLAKKRKQKSKPNNQKIIKNISASNTNKTLIKPNKNQSKHKQINEDNQNQPTSNVTDEDEFIQANFCADKQKTKKPYQKKTKKHKIGNKKVKHHEEKSNDQNPIEFQASEIDEDEEQLGRKKIIKLKYNKYSYNKKDEDTYDEDDWFEEELTKQGLSVMQTCLEWMCIKFSNVSVADKSTRDFYRKDKAK